MSPADNRSNLGLNTWVLGEFDWQDRTDPYDLVRTAVHNDLTHLDCSPLYANGASEETVGTILEDLGVRKDCFMASKFGYRWTESRSLRPIGDYDRLCHQVEGSLERFDLDTLDLCYLYQSTIHSCEQQAQWVSRLREDGYCQNVGLVVLEPEFLSGPIPETFDYVQRPGSPLDQFEEPVPVPQGCTSVGYDPLYGGLFDQRYAEVDSEVLDYEVRRHHPKFTANRVEYLSTLKDLQHSYREKHQNDLPLESRTLRWLRNWGGDQHYVLGMRNADDVHRALQGKTNEEIGPEEEERNFLEPIRRVWEKQESPEFVAPPPLLPRHSFERHVLAERVQW